MNDKRFPPPQDPAATTVADVLLAMGELMQGCHRDLLEFQEALSASLPHDGANLPGFEACQRLDHVTQVHEDLGRLLPYLAKALSEGAEPVDNLSGILRLASLRDHLFLGGAQAADQPPPGKVDFL